MDGLHIDKRIAPSSPALFASHARLLRQVSLSARPRRAWLLLVTNSRRLTTSWTSDLLVANALRRSCCLLRDEAEADSNVASILREDRDDGVISCSADACGDILDEIIRNRPYSCSRMFFCAVGVYGMYYVFVGGCR